MPRALIGMVHVGALPGTPRATDLLPVITERAVEEARLYHSAGFNAVMVENMHDRPYLARDVGPEITAAMTVVASAVRRSVPIPLGVQVLAGANREALAVALASDASFVRVEGFVFAHVADEGLIEADAGALLRYRNAIGAGGVRVFADIKKKHSSHAVTIDVDLVETARAAEFALADGVIVTGAATGRETDATEVESVVRAVDLPVLVGSGVTADNVSRYRAAHALIVGSWAKRDGRWDAPCDPDRIARLAAAFAELR
ncbi:MAG: BtpA/SgcQ family protein [Candidatus Eisenbacteria bacterium]|uniref:BtpA/SgcQ family protein n=1 Tax=Eiseniibacteriota bacterium TaxID=2212470 RepID=A0A849SIQ0_UNCEI|nr:BtpA/SgcQ family protein [Candidatus Eisenbacteria bacterium]